jgi:hypothetical protein
MKGVRVLALMAGRARDVFSCDAGKQMAALSRTDGPDARRKWLIAASHGKAPPNIWRRHFPSGMAALIFGIPKF